MAHSRSHDMVNNLQGVTQPYYSTSNFPYILCIPHGNMYKPKGQTMTFKHISQNSDLNIDL